MNNFVLQRPRDTRAAIAGARQPDAAYIAGGTTVVDLWKLGAYPVNQLVDLTPLNLRGIRADSGGLRLGALERMSTVGGHADVKASYPVVAQALLLSASPQIRNMGTMGGNLLQRPRSVTYRNPDPSRQDGPSRFDAIFGVTDFSRAPHPSDLAVALTALDATVLIQGAQDSAERPVKLSAFYRVPSQSVKFDTLALGDLITAIEAQVPFARRSAYVKIRDRASYQFAIVSAAAVLDLDGDTIREARLAAGGVGTIPWRFPEVEAALQGQSATPASFRRALAGIGRDAVTHAANRFKVELLQRTSLRALEEARALT